MKHSNLIGTQCKTFKKTNAVPVIVFSFFLALAACKKEQIAENENARQSQPAVRGNANSLMLESIVLNDSVPKMRTQHNLKQLAIAAHNYDDGSFKKEMAYEYDAQGRLLIAVESGIYRSVYEHDLSGKIVKSSVYSKFGSVPDYTVDYSYNASGDLANWQANYGNSGNTTPGGNGVDILIANTGYDRNPDGTVRSIVIYANNDSTVPVGKVMLYYNVAPAQVSAWKVIAGNFPEPEIPWEVLTMLCNRIEMYGNGKVANEDLVDGKIQTAGNFVFNKEGFLLSKDVKSYNPGLVSAGSTTSASTTNYHHSEYKYVSVRR